MAGKYGRRDPKNAPALMLGQFLNATTPEHPDVVDYAAKVTDWQMLGNDKWGDCVAVTWANDRHLVTTYLADKPAYPDLEQVLAFYRTQNPPGHDDGMDIQTALEELVKNGGPDGVKAVAFAKVDVADLDELRAAIAIFGSVWLGIQVTEANETQFDQGQPWDYVHGSYTVGGHGIAAGGYDPRIRFITWAKESTFTDAFCAHQLTEAWVCIWPEHYGTRAFQQGVDQAALAAAYEAITGRALPAPTPGPPPPPPATADALDRALWAVVGPWARSRRHSHLTKPIAQALLSWAKSKGLT